MRMVLPEDIRQFRDLSLLHDNTLSPAQREELLLQISSETLVAHEMFVQKLLGNSYSIPTPDQNRAITSLLQRLLAYACAATRNR